jgi:tungstate transport system ATP-binding protein
MAGVIEVQDLVVSRDKRVVLTVGRLSIEAGETLAVIGPNGAGKSTLLQALAGLLQPTAGRILFRGQPARPWADLAYRRRIALVLQEPLLVNASVADNIAAGLRFRGLPRGAVKRRVDEWLERLGIAHLRRRPARKLSGGEAQRASLARALALQPELLLLDEPFSALDAPTRARLLDDFQTLLETAHTTTILVTHDLDEALRLGDRTAVILAGRLRQAGPPEEVFAMPTDPEVAAFVGVETVVAGQVVQARDGLALIAAHGFQLEAVGEIEIGRSVWLCLRPEDVTLWETDEGHPLEGGSARNRLSGVIVRLVSQGPLVRVTLDCGFPLVSLVTRASAQEMGLAEGQQVTATFKASAAHVIPR